MANLVTDSTGKPSPQYLSEDGSRYEYQQGKNGALNINIKGVDYKDVSTNNVRTALPIQLVNINGNVVDTFYEPSPVKTTTTIIPENNRTGVVETAEISTNSASNITIVINKVSGDNLIGSFSLEGYCGNKFIQLFEVENITIEDNKSHIITVGINSNDYNMVVPSKVKVKLNTSTDVTYGVYLISM